MRMQNQGWVAVVAAVLAVSAWGQEAAVSEAEEESVAQPNLVLVEPVFEFGEVDNSETVTHTFVLRNEGDAPLEISDVKPDCGCTTADAKQRTVAPGEETELTASLKLAGRYGALRKRVRIFSNDPDTPHAVVTLSGTATSMIDVAPRTISVRGTKEDPIGVQTVTVTSAMSHPLPIVSVNTGNPHVSAELVTEHQDFIYRVLLSPNESLPGGQTHGNLIITTSSTLYPEIKVPYILMLADKDFILVPPQLMLPENPDQEITRQFIIRPGLAGAFKVTEVVPPADHIEVDIRPVNDGTMIRLRKMKVTSDMNDAAVKIVTDVEGAEPVELPIRVLPKS